MSTNKLLYKFSVNKEKEVQETTKTKNEKGEEISITKTVKKNFPIEFAIKKPNRKLYEEGELFFSVALSEGIKAGLLTRHLLAKRYDNDGGFMSETDKQRYADLYRALFEKETELQKAQLNLQKIGETEKTKNIGDLIVEMSELRRELQEFENFRSSIFDQTAENRAKNKTLMWWVLNLALKKEDGSENFKSLFGEGNYESKLDEYDKAEESEDLSLQEGIKKFAYFISFWYSGQLNKEEDFRKLEDVTFPVEGAEKAEAKEGNVEAPKVAEIKAEETKAEETKAEETKTEEIKPEGVESKALVEASA